MQNDFRGTLLDFVIHYPTADLLGTDEGMTALACTLRIRKESRKGGLNDTFP